MEALDTTPTYNLKVVVQETGLRPDTLRAWERRYGLPQPDRSGGGHRLYSRRDIEILKWLAAREAEGMSISRAVILWRRLEADGQDPLAEAAAAPPRPAASYAPVGLSVQAATLAPSELRQTWLAAVYDFRELAAEQILTQAFALYPPELVCTEVLQKGVRDAGEGWCRGQVSIQQEHFLTELATRRLEVLLSATPPPTRPERLLIACAPGEEHAFSPLLLTFLLRRRGIGVVYLGANVPVARLGITAQTTQPHMVILTAQRVPQAATVAEAAATLHRERVRVGFGGAVFNQYPGLRQRVAGHFLGEDLNQAPDVIERLLAASPPWPPAPPPLPPEYVAALDEFRQRHASIEAQVWQSAQTLPDLQPHLEAVNTSLARNLGAALALGDVNAAEAEVMWKECLPDELRLAGHAAPHYLALYYEAARAVLQEHGELVTGRLARLLKESRA